MRLTDLERLPNDWRDHLYEMGAAFRSRDDLILTEDWEEAKSRGWSTPQAIRISREWYRGATVEGVEAAFCHLYGRWPSTPEELAQCSQVADYLRTHVIFKR